MSKETAYKEMSKDFDKGKRTWTFDEMAEIAKTHLGISKERTLHCLSKLGKEQEERKLYKHKQRSKYK